MISRLAIPFSLIMLVVVGAVRTNPANTRAIDAYHTNIADVINEIPLEVGGWIGRVVPLPQSATSLLNPNAIIAHEYFHKDKRVVATLMIVQCRDARDMGGHYPPVCYPANGWTDLYDGEVQTYTIDEHDLRIYGFRRVAGKIEREIIIYGLFALPTGEITTSMRDVRQLSADYGLRKYGAAQLQIMIQGEVDIEEHSWILEDMYEIARPAIQAVLDAQLRQEQDEEGAS